MGYCLLLWLAVAATTAARFLPVCELSLSEAWMNSMAACSIHTTAPVNDFILGSRVTGVAVIDGRLSLDIKPGDDTAACLVVLRGTCRSRTVSCSGPARVYSTATTRFTATKRVTLDAARGFAVEPGRISASTCSSISSVESRLRGPLGGVVRRIAWRRSHRLQAAANAIACRDARRGIVSAFDREVARSLRELQGETGLVRLVGGGWLRVGSTDEEVRVSVGRE